MSSSTDFDARVDSLDVSLFTPVPSGTSDGDRRSLLGLQKAVRDRVGDYVYLEIGSHLGGSLQPHLLDPRCRKIYSIDKRPAQQPDERGMSFPYPGNTTRRMLDLLKQVAPDGIEKIECFDSDARDIDPGLIKDPPNLCFVDGEHTNRAVVSDFQFCFSVCVPNAVIAFHDAHIVQGGIQAIVGELRKGQVAFKDYRLDDTVYAIALGQAEAKEAGVGASMEGAAEDCGSTGQEADGTGWLLEPNPEALAARMREVVANPREAREKGRRASRYVQEHLTWAQAAERALARLQALGERPIKRAEPGVGIEESGAEAKDAVKLEGDEREREAQDPGTLSDGAAVDVMVLRGVDPDTEEFEAALVRFTGMPYRRLNAETVRVPGSEPGVEGPQTDVSEPGREGMAALLNRCLDQVHGDYVALLRDNVVVTADWLVHLLDHMRDDPSIAMIGPRTPVAAGAQRAKARYKSTGKELQRFARRLHQREKGRREGAQALVDACVVIRASVLRDLGGFNAEFRTGAFLADFARRCRQRGERVVCARDTYVHSYGQEEPRDLEAREREAVERLEEGDGYRAAGESEKAIGCYRESLAAKPGYVEPALVLSASLLEEGRPEEAAEPLHELAEGHPDSSRIQNYLGRCLYQQGKTGEARERFEAAIALDADFAEVHSNLGVLFWETGELDRALERLNRAAELSPADPDVIYNIGMVYIQLGQVQEAEKMLRHYLESRPEDLDARVHLSMLLLENGKESDGVGQLERVLAQDPEHAEALKVVRKLQEAVDGTETGNADEGG